MALRTVMLVVIAFIASTLLCRGVVRGTFLKGVD